MTRVWLVVALAVGLAAGAAGALALQPDPPNPPATPTLPARDVSLPSVPSHVLLVWTHGGLPAGLADGVRRLEGVETVTAVRGDSVDLVASFDAAGRSVENPAPGWSIPIDAMALTPPPIRPSCPSRPARCSPGSRAGQALLGATSARLRRLGPGGAVQLADGTRATIAAVVDGSASAAAEVIVSAADPAAWAWPERYLLVANAGERTGIEKRLQFGLVGDQPVRFRGPGETPFLCEGDAVLPQALIKDRFGEFAYRNLSGRDIEIDPAWVATHIVTSDVPILGRVTCNRAVIGTVHVALAELAKDNLAPLVDPATFAGCFAAKRIGPDEPVSRHTWGVALDINYGGNQTGVSSGQDPRLVAVMARYGFTSGADSAPNPTRPLRVHPPGQGLGASG